MKKLLLCSLLLMTFGLSGCLVRTVPYEVDRVDQELNGNRGIVRGKTSGVSETEKKTKTMYRIEIELPDSSDKEKRETKTEKTSDKVTTGGNKGFMQVKKSYEREKGTQKKRQNIVRLGSSGASSRPQVVFQETSNAGKKGKYSKEKGGGKLMAEEGPKSYVVQKGDTLQKISDKVYGTTKRWKEIYEANRETLKSPDLITPGQELVIP